jgi:hypothetical protein
VTAGPAGGVPGSGIRHVLFDADGVIQTIPGGWYTWVTAGQDSPVYRLPALLADTAVWTLIGLSGCFVVRLLTPSAGGGRPTAKPVRPAGGGA